VVCIRGNGIIHRAHKVIQGDECRPRRSSWLITGPLLSLWTLECVVRGNVGIHRAPKAIQVDGSRPRRVSWQGFPALPYPEPLRVTGPLPSLVLRAEDMWRRRNQCHRSERALNPGFPFSPLMFTFVFSSKHKGAEYSSLVVERVCCLLVLNLVSSTLSCIRQPRPRLRVLDVCGFV